MGTSCCLPQPQGLSPLPGTPAAHGTGSPHLLLSPEFLKNSLNLFGFNCPGLWQEKAFQWHFSGTSQLSTARSLFSLWKGKTEDIKMTALETRAVLSCNKSGFRAFSIT